jgi:hypothetical protein
MPGFSTLSLACVVHSLVRVQDGPVGDVVIVWQSLLLELFSFPSAPGAVLADGTGANLAPPLLPREFRYLIRHLPEPALPSACRKSVSRLLPDPQLAVMIRLPHGRPVEPARHILQQQVTTLQPLPTQRFQVFYPSFQCSFHLSFVVLVRYRSPINI